MQELLMVGLENTKTQVVEPASICVWEKVKSVMKSDGPAAGVSIG